VIINDRVDVAIAAGADGVHVGQSDIPARLVRQMIGPDKIMGISVKTPAEAAKAQVRPCGMSHLPLKCDVDIRCVADDWA
jgi:thiamine-phosphate diphosphorylase